MFSSSSLRNCPRYPCKATTQSSVHLPVCEYHRCLQSSFSGTLAQVMNHFCCSNLEGNVPSTDPFTDTSSSSSSNPETMMMMNSSSPQKRTSENYSTDPSSAPPTQPTTTAKKPLTSYLPQKRRFLSTLEPSRDLTNHKPLINPYDSFDAKRVFSSSGPSHLISSSNSTVPKTSSSSPNNNKSPIRVPNTHLIRKYSNQTNKAGEEGSNERLQKELIETKVTVTKLFTQLNSTLSDFQKLLDVVNDNDGCDLDILQDAVLNVCGKRIEQVRELVAGSSTGLSLDIGPSSGVGCIEESEEEEEEEEEEEAVSSSDSSSSEEEENDDSSTESSQQTLRITNDLLTTTTTTVDRAAEAEDDLTPLPEDLMTSNELTNLVRSRISSRPLPPLAQQEDIFGPDEREPTNFVRQLVDTTWDPAQDVKSVPCKCNLINLFMDVGRIRLLKRKRGKEEEEEQQEEEDIYI